MQKCQLCGTETPENSDCPTCLKGCTDTVELSSTNNTRQLIRIRPEWAQLQLALGVIAIIFSPLGIHKFILGYPKAGITMLSITILSVITMVVTSILFNPLVWVLLPLLWIVGATEGFIYLILPTHIFYRVYIRGHHPWF